MRLLRVNDVNMDIDDQTAIGVDLQSYDIQNIGDTFVKITNTFTVPATVKNLAVFGLPNNPQSVSTKVYEEAICDYWVNNDHIIDTGKISVQEIQDRISLFVFEKASIWDILKSVFFTDFIPDYITWLQSSKGYYSSGSPFVGAFSTFVQEFADSLEHLILPMTWGNQRSQFITLPSGEQVPIERFSSPVYAMYLYNKFVDIYGNDIETYGGHFCIYAKSIFQYIEYTYGVNFLTSGGILNGNIWDDPVANAMYIDAKDITVNVTGTTGNFSIYFKPVPTDAPFLPHQNIKDKADKTLYDFVLSFMQHLNIIKDDFEIAGEKIIRLARFDDLETLADVEEFSGLTGKPKYKPFVDGYAQTNYIKFKTIFEEGDSLLNSKAITLNNLNIDKVKTLFEIDAHVPGTYINGIDTILDLSKKEAFKTFTFMVSNGDCSFQTLVAYVNQGVISNANATVYLPQAALYSLDSEYNFLDDALTYPVWYEIQKWLTPPQVKNFEFFKQRWIKELNGAFFVNKIKGFNPDKSNEPVTLEVLKISDRTPVTPPDLDYWIDGAADPWFDGVADYWY